MGQINTSGPQESGNAMPGDAPKQVELFGTPNRTKDGDLQTKGGGVAAYTAKKARAGTGKPVLGSKVPW